MTVLARNQGGAQSPIERRGRKASAFFATLLAGIAATLLVATPAFAHNYYVESTPGIGEVLTTLPEEFVVTTNDNLLNLAGAGGGFIMKVTGPDGLYYGDGCVSVNGPSASMAAALGPAGEYTLAWQVISADGHTISDVIPFSWQPAAGDESSTKGSTAVPNCGNAVVAPPVAPTPQEDGGSITDVLWIVGGVLGAGLAFTLTLLLLRPKKTRNAEESLNQESLNQESLNQESLNQESLNHESLNQDPPDQDSPRG